MDVLRKQSNWENLYFYQKDEISRLQQENEQLRAELERLKADRG